MRNYILIFVNGQPYQVSGADAFLTLSDFLRIRPEAAWNQNRLLRR